MKEKIMVGPTQRRILGFLETEPDLSFSIPELAHRIGMEPSIVRKAVDRMFKRGMLLRSTTDERGTTSPRLRRRSPARSR